MGRPEEWVIHNAHDQLGPAPRARLAPFALDLTDVHVALFALLQDQVLALDLSTTELRAEQTHCVVASGMGACERWADDRKVEDEERKGRQPVEYLDVVERVPEHRIANPMAVWDRPEESIGSCHGLAPP
eukprot:7379942-Prymnesium_polylepis.2